MKTGVLLLTHGTVDDLGDLRVFLTNIRRGHAPPEALVQEMAHRYEVIGGRSPLNEITARLAKKVECALSMPVRFAARLWRPTVDQQLGELVAAGASRVVLVPMAQFSSLIYCEHAKTRAQVAGLSKVEFVSVPDWGSDDCLHHAFVHRARTHLATLPQDGSKVRILVTAHSLPMAVIRAGDAYEREFRRAADRFAAALLPLVDSCRVVFQSQGQSLGPGGKPAEWLGPDLPSAIAEAKADGVTHLVFAPLGFLADHVEILYDLDIEARALAQAAGLSVSRTASLNDDDDLVRVVEGMVLRALQDASP